MFYFTIFITALFFSGYECTEGYYWREYLGVIPNDALVAGKTSSGINVYIGQAYIKNGGLVVVQLTPGIKQVYAPIGGTRITDKYIKVLCGDPQNFYWMKANSTTLHLDINGKHAVIGGQEDTYGYMNIGRINYGGDTKVGKVNSFWPESATFYFIDNGAEKLLGSYEILIYKDGEGDLDSTIKKLFS